MSLHRRAFLATLAAATTGALLDPERLAWVPGKTSYFDIQRPPVPEGWTATVSGLLKRGDIITIDGYYDINAPDGRLQEFEVVSGVSGHVIQIDRVLPRIEPPILDPGRIYRAEKPAPIQWAPPVKRSRQERTR